MADIKERLNIIGAGQLGKTLGRLFSTIGMLEIGDVLNRSPESSRDAIEFIGAGRSITAINDMQPAAYYLLACPDNQIEACCEALVTSGVLQDGVVVFHCSGSLSSSVLESASKQGVQIASVHPVYSFANPEFAVQRFSGTYCGMEGDSAALVRLESLFKVIGGIPFRIDAANKTLYHAASVMACNNLVVLQEMSLQAFGQAGVERELGMKILQPLVEGTARNVFDLGTAEALTGPVARGDNNVVVSQLSALTAWRPEVGAVYQILGREALSLARQQDKVSPEQLDKVERALNSSGDTLS